MLRFIYLFFNLETLLTLVPLQGMAGIFEVHWLMFRRNAEGVCFKGACNLCKQAVNVQPQVVMLRWLLCTKRVMDLQMDVLEIDDLMGSYL